MYIISLCKHKSKGGEETLRSYKGVLFIFETRINQRGGIMFESGVFVPIDYKSFSSFSAKTPSQHICMMYTYL